MSNALVSHESPRLLSRSHNSTVLKKCGSSQKGLYTRKKRRKKSVSYQLPEPLFTTNQIIFAASKTIDLFKSTIEETNIIVSFHNAIGISVPPVLYWVPTILVIVIILSFCVFKHLVDCAHMLFRSISSNHRITIRNMSSSTNVSISLFNAWTYSW